MKEVLHLDKIHLKRTSLLVTSKCTLNCKLCSVYIPYWKDKEHYSVDYIERIFSNYFKIVDYVHTFTFTGGEPCMHPDLIKIYESLFAYQEQFNEVHLVTNNTIKFSEELLNFFEKNKSRIKLILDDYGPDLSLNFSYNKIEVEKRGISHRIIKFYGEDACYGGWIDLSDHSLKWHTLEERNAQAAKCYYKITKHPVLYRGELHYCSRSAWRMHQNIIPRTKGEYIDLLNETISINEKRTDLIAMESLLSGLSCGRCVGATDETARHKPAEQL